MVFLVMVRAYYLSHLICTQKSKAMSVRVRNIKEHPLFSYLLKIIFQLFLFKATKIQSIFLVLPYEKKG